MTTSVHLSIYGGKGGFSGRRRSVGDEGEGFVRNKQQALYRNSSNRCFSIKFPDN